MVGLQTTKIRQRDFIMIFVTINNALETTVDHDLCGHIGDRKLTLMLYAGVSGIPCLVVCKKDGTLVTKDGRAGVTSMVI